MHRFMKGGNNTSMPGQEGIPAVYSPMARTLADLETFWRAVVSMKPWEYDHSVSRVPSSWDRARLIRLLSRHLPGAADPVERRGPCLREADPLGSAMG